MYNFTDFSYQDCFPYDPFLLTASAVRSLRERFVCDGVAVAGPQALAPMLFQRLAAEAAVQRLVASWPLHTLGGNNQIREDNTRGHIGPIGRELMASGATRALIQAVTGRVVRPAWSASCLTYYDKPGNYLGVHCDKEDACGVALLLCLNASWPDSQPPGCGLKLHVYDCHIPKELRVLVTARSNRLTILDGVARCHERPPVADGEHIALLCGCYEVVG